MLAQTPLSGMKIFAVSLTLFAVSDSLGKRIVDVYHPAMLNVFRYALLLFLTVILLSSKHQLRDAIHAPYKKYLILRGLLQGGSGVAYFTAMMYIPLSVAASILFCAPLLIVALSPYLLKEKVGLRQWVTVLLAMMGMLCLVNPSNAISINEGSAYFGVACALVAMVFYACVQIVTKKLSGKTTVFTQMFYGNGMSLLVTFIPAYFAMPILKPFTSEIALDLTVLVLLSIVAQVLFVQAFLYTRASDLAPLNYLQLAITILIGIIIFNEIPTIFTAFGMFLIFLAGTAQGWFASRGLK